MEKRLAWNIDWNPEKNEELLLRHGVCFEDVEAAIMEARVLEIAEHHNHTDYPHQKKFIFVHNNYIYIAPFVIDHKRNCLFLKTLYPSRKATKQYRNKI
jgi:uncharacterized DUF497 family protein